MACSFLRPIEPTLRATLTTAVESQHIMLNTKLGTEMTNELEMHFVDPGSPDPMGDDRGPRGGGDPGMNSMSASQLEGEDDQDELSPMQ